MVSVVLSPLLSFSLSLSDVPAAVRISFISLLIFSLEQYQKRRANVVVAQNLAQQPVTVTTYSYQPAPVVHVQQGFVQPQPTYTAPMQFPNTQVNMNYGGNAGFQQYN